MQTFGKMIGVGLIAAAALFFVIIIGTAFGAVTGWTVGLVFGDTILGVLGRFGVTGVTMWQFGAFLGFVGGFLRSAATTASK